MTQYLITLPNLTLPQCNKVYKLKYGPLFIRVVVIAFRWVSFFFFTEHIKDKIYKIQNPHVFHTARCKLYVFPFRPVSKIRAEQNVQAELELVFDQISNEPIPSNSEIVQTLKEAATNPNSGFNLTIDVTSIAVISKLLVNYSLHEI